MPLKKYFGGKGDKVMEAMKKEYGEEKGEKVFYAKANKDKMKMRKKKVAVDYMAKAMSRGMKA